MMQRGDVVLSEEHIEAAKGPYVVVHQLGSEDRFCVVASLDNKFVVNIKPKNLKKIGTLKQFSEAIKIFGDE